MVELTQEQIDQFVTKKELAIQFSAFEERMDRKMDKRFDELRDLMIQCFDLLSKKLDATIDRLDKHMGQCAIEHSHMDSRIRVLELDTK